MIARRIATVVATVLAASGLGAFGSVATTEARRTGAVTVAPVPASAVRAGAREVQAARNVQSGRDFQAAARAEAAVQNVPSAFRLPPGSQVTALTDTESGASFTLTAPGSEAVLSFYRRELPLGAFTIVADQAEPGATSLAFRGTDGWAGTIFATAHRATVALRRA